MYSEDIKEDNLWLMKGDCLERIQYVGMSTVDGHYEVTMGWSESIKLNEDIYPRKELIKKWKAYHGHC